MTMNIGAKFSIQLNRNKNNVDSVPLEEKLKEHLVPITASGRTKLGTRFRKPHSLKRIWKYPRPTDWGPRNYRVKSRSKSQAQSLQKLRWESDLILRERRKLKIQVDRCLEILKIQSEFLVKITIIVPRFG